MKTRFLSNALASLLVTIPLVCNAASNDNTLLPLLLCLENDHQGIGENPLSKLEQEAKHDQDGSFTIAWAFHAHGACISQVRIAGAFGVTMMSGVVGDCGIQPILDIVRQKRPQLSKQVAAMHSGVIATYADSEYSISFYHGQPGFDRAISPDFKTTSYICTYRMGGHQ